MILLNRYSTDQNRGKSEEHENDVESGRVASLIEDFNQKHDKAPHEHHDEGGSNEFEDNLRDGTLFFVH